MMHHKLLGLGLCGNGDYVVDADGSLASGPRYESVLVIKKIIEATNHSMQQPSNFPSPTMSGCCKFPELEVFTPASPFSSKKQEKSKIRLITRSKFNIFRNSFRCVTSVWTKIRNLIVLKTYLNLRWGSSSHFEWVEPLLVPFNYTFQTSSTIPSTQKLDGSWLFILLRLSWRTYTSSISPSVPSSAILLISCFLLWQQFHDGVIEMMIVWEWMKMM